MPPGLALCFALAFVASAVAFTLQAFGESR